jgi:hypothetical protein
MGVMATDEEKLLAILNQDDAEYVEGATNYLEALKEESPELAEAVGAMLTPEEIIKQAKIMEHNAQVQAKRDERQARKRARRQNKQRRRRR